MSNYDCKGCKHRTNHTDEGFKFCSGCDRSYLGADSGYHADRYEKEEAEMSMTESEALEVLKKPTEHIRAEDDDCIFSSAYARALETAMDALEELQQYRAIGTVSEFRELKEKATERCFAEDTLDGYGYTCTNKTCSKRIREKTIEEFAEACKNHIFCQTFGLHPKTIDEIARELKGE